MDDSDSDSSRDDGIGTSVFLGFASKDGPGDGFSQLGGRPTWLDGTTAPPGTLAICKVCNGLMNLLVQLHSDLPDRFPGHERRLYIFACRRKACRRKEGSVRGVRARRQTAVSESLPAPKVQSGNNGASTPQVKTDLGEALFGVKAPPAQTNPFASSGSSNPPSNPFSTTAASGGKSSESNEPSRGLSETFAQKVRISAPEPQAQEVTMHWPELSAFPPQYPSYYIDADQEYIDSSPDLAAAHAANVTVDGDSSSSAANDKAAFESSMDKTFQRFADRLAQNPEQVLRYEFSGRPLLYSKTDSVGTRLSPSTDNAAVKVAAGMPRCPRCGAERAFEMQLTPHAIAELEADEISVDGMDWGTIILGVCSQDCVDNHQDDGSVGYWEEWIGVQWEEQASSTMRS